MGKLLVCFVVTEGVEGQIVMGQKKKGKKEKLNFAKVLLSGS